MLLFIVCRIGDFNGLYGQDAYEYARYAEEINQFFKGGEFPKPFFWPIIFPLCGAILKFFIGDIAVSLQLVSVFSLGGTAFFLSKILNAFFPEKQKKSRWFILIFICFSPYLIRSSVQVLADSLGLFFLVCGSYHSLLYLNSRKGKDLWLTLFLLCMSCMTRYGNAVVAVIPLGMAGYSAIKDKRFQHILFACTAGVLAVLPHLILQHKGNTSFLSHPWLTTWSPANLFSREFSTPDGILSFDVPNIVYVGKAILHPGFIFPALLFLITSFSIVGEASKFLRNFCISWIAVYGFFLAGIPYQNTRYLIPLIPPIAILCFPGFSFLTDKFSDRKRYLIAGISIAILTNLTLSVLASKKSYFLNREEKLIANGVCRNFPGSVYTVGFEGSMKYYCPERKVISIWKRGFENPQNRDLILLNEARWGDQWRLLEVAENIAGLKEKYSWVLLEDFPDNWKLYQLEVK